MQSGRAIKQTHFSKLRTSLSGQGWVPAGLDGLDYSSPLLLKCAAPRCISSQNHQIAIPAVRRNDRGFEPKGYALIEGELIETAVLFQANIANLRIVPEADIYQVHYYPELMVFAEPSQVQGNMAGAEFSWALTCEEL